MSNVEVVIKIPEEVKNRLCFGVTYPKDIQVVCEALNAGTQLPKGHGDLKDADVLDRDLENAQVNLGDALSEAFDDGLTWAGEVVSKSSTIIEADTSQDSEE